MGAGVVELLPGGLKDGRTPSSAPARRRAAPCPGAVGGRGRPPVQGPRDRRDAMLAALRKELLLQWRSRAQLLAVLVFGAAALLLFSFAIGPDASALRQFSAGFL